MNKFCGYITFRYNEAKDWFCEEYLVYDELTREITWTEEPNDATIFPSIDSIKDIYPGDHPEMMYKKVVMVTVDD